MTENHAITRRSALVGASTAGGVLLLAACSSSAKDDPTVAAAATPTTAATSAGTSAADTSAANTSAAATSAADTSAASGTKVVALADVPVGGAVSATGKGDAKLIVAQPTAGKVVAFSAVCTHMQCTVAPKGTLLECPCHHSEFDMFTGKVLQTPAPAPLPSVAVSIVDGNVVQA